MACSVLPILAHMVSKGESLNPANITGWLQTLPLLALEKGQGPEHILRVVQMEAKSGAEKGLG